MQKKYKRLDTKNMKSIKEAKYTDKIYNMTRSGKNNTADVYKLNEEEIKLIEKFYKE